MFIPDGRITQDESADGFVYSDTLIIAKDISKVKATMPGSVLMSRNSHNVWHSVLALYVL